MWFLLGQERADDSHDCIAYTALICLLIWDYFYKLVWVIKFRFFLLSKAHNITT